VTVVRLSSGDAGSRGALYVVTGAPTGWVGAFWVSSSKLKEVAMGKDVLHETLPTGTTAVLELQPGQCVVARHELRTAEDDSLDESLRILERRWTFFMCAATRSRVQALELVFLEMNNAPL
jgi:hypothetical protein